MSSHTLSQYARDIACVTFSMLEALGDYDDDQLPGGYRYDMFAGFMGFCDHAGAAGLALAKAYDGVMVDAWAEIVDDYAHRVIAHAVRTGCPASAQTLKAFAARAHDSVSSNGGAP